MARGRKFRNEEVEGLYNPCSENKVADQLCGYREADLRLCFLAYAKSRFFHDTAHFKEGLVLKTKSAYLKTIRQYTQ